MENSAISKTPEPPYYAVIFTSTRTEWDRGYGKMAEKMNALAAEQPGYLGMETARTPEGLGITVSYWKSLEDIANWKAEAQHQIAQHAGKYTWYQDYHIRIAKVEREYGKNP
jgi:heme-degrading monooxygenase HmoA